MILVWPPEPGAGQGVRGDTSPDAGGTHKGDTYPEAGQAGELAMERGEAVVTHGEVFLQGSPRQAPMRGERRQGCVGQQSGPHADVGAPQSQESRGLAETWGELSPDPHEAVAMPPVSNWLICPSVSMLPPRPSFPGADLAETPQPCCRVGDTPGCY